MLSITVIFFSCEIKSNSFLGLVLTLAVLYSWVCPHDYCHMVKCTALTAETCAGIIVANGSTYGCCDKCVHVLEPGQNCFALLLWGEAATVACPDGYFCYQKTITCQPLVN